MDTPIPSSLPAVDPSDNSVVEIAGTFNIFVTKNQRQTNRTYTHATLLTDEGLICHKSNPVLLPYRQVSELHPELKYLIEQTLRRTFGHDANWCNGLYFTKFSFVADEG